MSDCLFCKIAAGEIPSSKIYEDERCFAFKDIAPQAPTHFLVIPKAHIGSVSEVTAENGSIVGHIFEVIAKLAKEQHLERYRVVQYWRASRSERLPFTLPRFKRPRHDMASGLIQNYCRNSSTAHWGTRLTARAFHCHLQ